MKTMLSIPLICLALNASAACPVQGPGEAPVLPDGAVASQEEMYQAQLDVENYLLQANTYLDCKVMNRRQHNRLLTQLEVFSELYNEELMEFQVRTNMIAEK